MCALLENKTIRLEFHLQQLLPAIFTCIVASRLSSISENHWKLRSSAAQVIALICKKYSELFPDFQARFCKTYVDALTLSMSAILNEKDKEKEKEIEKRTSSLATMYGGLVGLHALGHTVVRSLLLPRAQELFGRINALDSRRTATTSSSVKKLSSRDMEVATDKCRCALVHAIGTYMVSRLNIADSLRLDDSFHKRERSEQSTVLTKKRRRLEDATSPVEGLEEVFVPYYASASRDLYYCRLFL